MTLTRPPYNAVPPARPAGLTGPPCLTEAQFLTQVIDLAHATGWLVTHFRPARTRRGWVTPIQGDAGAPDLVLCRPPHLIYAELKSSRGKLSREQEDWIIKIRQCGAECYLWRPEDWEEIKTVLMKPYLAEIGSAAKPSDFSGIEDDGDVGGSAELLEPGVRQVIEDSLEVGDGRGRCSGTTGQGAQGCWARAVPV